MQQKRPPIPITLFARAVWGCWPDGGWAAVQLQLTVSRGAAAAPPAPGYDDLKATSGSACHGGADQESAWPGPFGWLMTVDRTNGTILRPVVEADLQPTDPVARVAILRRGRHRRPGVYRCPLRTVEHACTGQEARSGVEISAPKPGSAI